VGLADCEKFWADWAARASVEPGPWRNAIMRSLVTLKGLTYAPTGGIVAAPTTSLPETFGGIRNWDYRFCWLRDATLSLLALMNAGYYEEAAAWKNWLLRAVAGNPQQAQIMYGIAGERRLTEWEVDWLPGYEGAKPVRIGNGAHGQLQLDVYGEVMDALYQAYRGGVTQDGDGWAVQRALLNHLAKIWQQPDRGIWESRGAPRQYTFSKVMAWVAFDRGIRHATEAGLPCPIERWRELAAAIHADVCTRGWDPELGSFVQSYGSKWLDGSLLLIPTTGFLPPEDPRIAGTVRAIEERLIADGFVMRHDPAEVETGLRHGEGAFLACSFWLADAYTLMGRIDEGQALFERLMSLRNDVGLLSEEYDVRTRRLAGNLPQAFSHIALVSTAHNLSRAAKPAEQRAGRAA
jgi:GH15 family glucan-1,4-alpha-glucosidase